MARENTFNFSAGPSALPTGVLERAAAELLDFGGSGMSVMEMSHRSKIYAGIFDEAKALFKELMEVPDTHEILFLQGGASTQFSMAPMNLLTGSGRADYAVTGAFSAIAAKEARKYGEVRIACDTSDCGHTRIPAQEELSLTPDADYFYYCSNNTIYGTEWQYVPETGGVPLVCDMSSDILSRRVDVSKYGLIFAGAQKNMAPAGLTVVVIDRRLAGREMPLTPLMLSYKLMIDRDSMYNTPPCYNIYMLGLVLRHLKENGGVAAAEKRKAARAAMLYDAIDSSRLFTAAAEKGSRSDMNVTFRTPDEALDAKFVAGAAAEGLVSLKGHRLAGGMRASIYNAMPDEGVERLCGFIKKFDRENG